MSQLKLLICTDMDRTIIPNGSQPEHPDARKRFKAFCDRPEVTLTYVTGRHQALVSQAIQDYALPIPDFAITDVGTKIYHVADGQWEVQQNWEDTIDVGWNGKSHRQIMQLLSHINDLQLQESSKQNTHKLSYYLPLNIDEKAVFARVKECLHEANVQVSLIWSIDEPKDIGLLDILPPNATKLHAITFLQQQLGYKHNEVIFAGDSGNDLPVLCSPIQSVLVDNASDEIKNMAQQLAEQNGYKDALYIAKATGLNMNGNYSAGVLQGVWHYASDFRQLLEQFDHEQ